MNDQRKNRRAGFYFVENVPYLSVTTALKAIDKPKLMYWFGKQVYLAVVKDPGISEQEAMVAPYKTSDKAKMRGTTIHSIVESYKNNVGFMADVPEELKGYADAFYSWLKDNHTLILDNEKTVVSKNFKYAGTADLVAKLNQKEETWVIDVKTGKDIYPEAFLQLSAYKHALEENGTPVDKMAVLLLQENGTYKFEVGEDQFEYFLAVQKVWTWINKDFCKEMGY